MIKKPIVIITKRRVLVLALSIVLLFAIFETANFNWQFPTAAATAPTLRSFSKKYSTNTHGDIAIIGNTLLTCPSSDKDCANGRNGTGDRQDNNDYYSVNMQYVDVDSDSTTYDSSTATLSMPTNSEVLWAGLYWGARVDNQATPDIDKVLLKTPIMSSYQGLVSAKLDGDKLHYSGFSDVTSLVQASGNGVYTVANVKTDLRSSDKNGDHADWGLVVVYSNNTLPARNLVVFDGMQVIFSDNPTESFSLSGFVTPTPGPINATLGILSWEGDRTRTGETITVNNKKLSNSLNPSDNVFNSTITSTNLAQGARNPSYVNQYGIDIDVFDASNIITPGSTSASIKVNSPGDSVYLNVITTAIDIKLPEVNLTKSVSDINGGDLQPGDTLEYTVTAVNNGTLAANSTALSDLIPANTTYLPGSLTISSGTNSGNKTDTLADDQADYSSSKVNFRLGAGANGTAGGVLGVGESVTIKFRVLVNNGVVGGTDIKNTATSSYVDIYGTSYTSSSNEVDISLAVTDPTAWLMTSNGDTYATNGWSDFNIKDINSGSIPSFITSLAGTDPYYLGTFSVGTGNSSILSSRLSKYKLVLTNYGNNVSKVPTSSDSTDYYDYIFNLATKSATPITTTNSSIPASANLNSQVAGLSNTNINLVLYQNTSLPNYKLTIGQGFTCNNRAVIFVNGDLDIEPDFLNSTNTGTTGCVFVVKRNITVLPGHSAGAGSYDQLQAFFIVAGTFTTQYDGQEGLFVFGGVQAKNVSLNRKLGSVLNANRPAEWFMLNPMYAANFGSILSLRHFSIRTQ